MNPSSLLKRSLSIFALAAILIALSSAYQPVSSQVCTGCQVSQSVVASANEQLNLNAGQRATAESIHLFAGLPVSPANATNEHIIHQREWITWYDDDLRVPLWVQYRLTRADARAQRTRRDCFRRDSRLSDEAASFCEDYQEPIFDRGHMVPRSDLNRTQVAMINSFIFSNMCPQQANFNQGIWENLESKVRRWAIVSDGVFVVTGAVFDKNEDGRRDDDVDANLVAPRRRVAIPTHFYKIIMHQRPSGFIDTISILLPHNNRQITKADRYLSEHIVSIDQIEALTGIDFFPNLPDDREAMVESFVAPGLWNTQ